MKFACKFVMSRSMQIPYMLINNNHTHTHYKTVRIAVPNLNLFISILNLKKQLKLIQMDTAKIRNLAKKSHGSDVRSKLHTEVKFINRHTTI